MYISKKARLMAMKKDLKMQQMSMLTKELEKSLLNFNNCLIKHLKELGMI